MVIYTTQLPRNVLVVPFGIEISKFNTKTSNAKEAL